MDQRYQLLFMDLLEKPHPNKKANVIAVCLENLFTSHDLCDENYKRQVETRVQALLASVNDTPLRKVRPCNIHKLANSLKVRKPSRLDCIWNEGRWHLPRRPLVHIYLNTTFGCPIFQSLGRKQKSTLAKPVKDPNFNCNCAVVGGVDLSRQEDNSSVANALGCSMDQHRA
jgi:hypothetical protein